MKLKPSSREFSAKCTSRPSKICLSYVHETFSIYLKAKRSYFHGKQILFRLKLGKWKNFVLKVDVQKVFQVLQKFLRNSYILEFIFLTKLSNYVDFVKQNVFERVLLLFKIPFRNNFFQVKVT